MNIFFLSRDQEACARYHCDSHVVAMVREYGQLLATAHHALGSRPPSYVARPSHVNHPCAVWARQSDGHYLWLAELYRRLAAEYTFRYDREHGAALPRRVNYLSRPPRKITAQGWVSDPPQCMPDQHKGLAVFAYRRYYEAEKAHLLRWRRRPIPAWIKR